VGQAPSTSTQRAAATPVANLHQSSAPSECPRRFLRKLAIQACHLAALAALLETTASNETSFRQIKASQYL